MVTLDKVIAEASKNNRVCPQPRLWNDLYNLLPNRQRKGDGWEPALPLILAAWYGTPPIVKAIRLREHIEWAEAYGVLEEVYKFMLSLKESDWYHYGE